jgi:hypothetical protein
VDVRARQRSTAAAQHCGRIVASLLSSAVAAAGEAFPLGRIENNLRRSHETIDGALRGSGGCAVDS